eukprot:scaffold284381_cov36-Tisochrysis_lutea.AAC.1
MPVPARRPDLAATTPAPPLPGASSSSPPAADPIPASTHRRTTLATRVLRCASHQPCTAEHATQLGASVLRSSAGQSARRTPST